MSPFTKLVARIRTSAAAWLERRALRERRVLAVLSLVAYAASFVPLFHTIGPGAATLCLLPVLLAALLLGEAYGLLTALVLLPVNFVLFREVGGTGGGALPLGLVTAAVAMVLGRTRDLSARLEQERAKLAESERQLAVAQEVSHTGSWQWDLETGEVSWSNEMYRLAGRAPAAARMGLEEHEAVIHPDDRARTLAALREVIDSGGRELSIDYRIVREDGSSASVHGRGEVLRDAAGKATKVIATAQDVTELRDMQRRMLLVDRMASVGTLAGGVAHEINNPLTYVMTNLDLVSESLQHLDGKPDAETLQALGDAREGAERVSRIVSDLQILARASDGPRGPVDVVRIIELSINMVSSDLQRRARLCREYDKVPPVLTSQTRLGQLMVHLLVNAAQALPANRAAENEIRIVTRRDARNVVIEVHDTGPGIAPELRERIFDPFFTTKEVGAGRGLGLSICHGLVESMGGEIRVDSEVGRGSTFTVSLPAHEEKARPALARRAA